MEGGFFLLSFFQNMLLLKRVAYKEGNFFDTWTERYEMELPQISLFLHSLSDGINPAMPNELGELLNVVPIMKKSAVDECQYTLTHAMQHENGSVVEVEINCNDAVDNNVFIKPQLLLEVIGGRDYSVRRQGSHGSGTKAQIRFLIIPPLPHHIDGIQFSLVPCAIPFEHRPKELVLDKQIDFA